MPDSGTISSQAPNLIWETLSYLCKKKLQKHCQPNSLAEPFTSLLLTSCVSLVTTYLDFPTTWLPVVHHLLPVVQHFQVGCYFQKGIWT